MEQHRNMLVNNFELTPLLVFFSLKCLSLRYNVHLSCVNYLRPRYSSESIFRYSLIIGNKISQLKQDILDGDFPFLFLRKIE